MEKGKFGNMKWMLVILCVMLLSVAAACSKSETNSEQPAPAAEKAPEKAPEAKVEVKEPEKPVELRIISRKLGTGNDVENSVLRELEKRLNLKLTWETKPPADFVKQSQVILSSGDLPDMMEVWWANPEKEIKEFAEDGVLVQLNDLLDKYGSDVRKARPFKETWLYPFGDDKVYTIPSRFNEFGIESIYTIRQDWLNNLGLKVPTNLNEFYEVAKAFTFNDPDKNGKNDTIGVGHGMNGNSSFFSGSPIELFMGAYGVMGGWNEVNGKLVYHSVAPGMLDALKYYRTLYQDGLVEPEFPIMTREKYLENKYKNKYGVSSWWTTHLDVGESAWYRGLLENVPTAELSFVPPLKSADGKQVWRGHGLRSYSPSLAIFTKDPVKQKKVMELINYLASDEGAELAAFGVEGKHWDNVDGKVKVRSLTAEEVSNSGSYLYSWVFRQKIYMRNAQDLVFKAVDTYKDHVVRPFELPTTPAQIEFMQGLNDLTNARFVAMVVDKNVNIDAEYEKFVADWNKAGGSHIH